MPRKPTRTMKVPTGAVLSKYLRALALDIETISPEGDPVTKAAALANLVWKHALGFKSPTDEKHPEKGETATPPAVWAIELLYNRIEGKIPVAVVEESGRSLTEKVSDLGKAKANSLAVASVDAENAPDEDEDE